MVGAPSAKADILDLIIEPMIEPVVNALSSALNTVPGVDPLSASDSLAGLDLSSLADTAGLAPNSIDAALTLPPMSADPLTGVAAASGPFNLALASSDFVQAIYLSLHTAGEDWINSPLGQFIDPYVNACHLPRGWDHRLATN